MHDAAEFHRLTGSAAGAVPMNLARHGELVQVTANFPAAPGAPPSAQPAQPAPATQPQPEPAPQRDVVQESLDHRAEQQRERDDAERRKVIDRAAATTLPPGTKDIAEAEAAGYAGQFGGIFTTLLGEAEGGGFLVGIDSVAAPLQRKGRVVLLPERLYQRLESDGTMGAMLRDKAAVLVRLMAPVAPGRQPALVELEVMR